MIALDLTAPDCSLPVSIALSMLAPHMWAAPWQLTCYSSSWGKSCVFHPQGKVCYLGSFSVPVSAAICYDEEATKLHGADAILNFPPGGNPSPGSADGTQV
jgi:hypothetical protein